MTYDAGLAHRVREALGARADHTEREMFGCIGFVIGGNVCCGVIDDSLIARVGLDAYDEVLEEPHARPFDFTGREMRGWVFVDHRGLATDVGLAEWIDRSLAFVETLPPK